MIGTRVPAPESSPGEAQWPARRAANAPNRGRDQLPARQFEALCLKNISYQLRGQLNKKGEADTRRRQKDPFLFAPVSHLASIVRMDDKLGLTVAKGIDLRDLVNKASQSMADKGKEPFVKSEVIKVVRKIQAEYEKKHELQFASGSVVSTGRREITGPFDFGSGYFEFPKHAPPIIDHHVRKYTHLSKAEPNHLKTLPCKDHHRPLGHRNGAAVSKDALTPVISNQISIFDKRPPVVNSPSKQPPNSRPKDNPILPKSPPLPVHQTASIVPAIALAKKPPIPKLRQLPKSVTRTGKSESIVQEQGAKLGDAGGHRMSREALKQSIVETPQQPSLPPSRLKYLEYFKDKEIGFKLLESFPKISSKSFVSRPLIQGGL